jgi:hypothetical protein
VQERGVDLQAVGDLAHAVVEHRVARDPQDAVLLAVPFEREADHVADDRVAERRPVAARRGGDLDRRPLGRFELRGLPRLESARVAAQSLRARGGGDHRAGRREERASGGIEVVVVVVVAEQDRVDRWEVGRGDRGSGQLARARAPAEVVLLTGRVEGRVGQQPPAADLDQSRRPADVGDANVLHEWLLWPIIGAPYLGLVSDLSQRTW